MLEIVERKAFASCVCIWADGPLTRSCKRQKLVNVGSIEGRKPTGDPWAYTLNWTKA